MRFKKLPVMLTWLLRLSVLALVMGCAATPPPPPPPPLLPAERARLEELHLRGIRGTDGNASQGLGVSRYRASNVMSPYSESGWGFVGAKEGPRPGKRDRGVSLALYVWVDSG